MFDYGFRGFMPTWATIRLGLFLAFGSVVVFSIVAVATTKNSDNGWSYCVIATALTAVLAFAVLIMDSGTPDIDDTPYGWSQFVMFAGVVGLFFIASGAYVWHHQTGTEPILLFIDFCIYFVGSCSVAGLAGVCWFGYVVLWPCCCGSVTTTQLQQQVV